MSAFSRSAQVSDCHFLFTYYFVCKQVKEKTRTNNIKKIIRIIIFACILTASLHLVAYNVLKIFKKTETGRLHAIFPGLIARRRGGSTPVVINNFCHIKILKFSCMLKNDNKENQIHWKKTINQINFRILLLWTLLSAHPSMIINIKSKYNKIY